MVCLLGEGSIESDDILDEVDLNSIVKDPVTGLSLAKRSKTIQTGVHVLHQNELFVTASVLVTVAHLLHVLAKVKRLVVLNSTGIVGREEKLNAILSLHTELVTNLATSVSYTVRP